MSSFQEGLLGHEKSMSCCSSDTLEKTCDMDQESDQQDKDDCCKGDDCQCACCLHLVFFKSIGDDFAPVKFYFSSPHSWKFNYSKEFEFSVFHPPLV